MTAGALTRPGEKQRLIVRLGEIDWTFCVAITVIAAAGGAMLYSVAGGKWSPWAAEHLIRYGFWFLVMIALAMVDLQVWFLIAYPLYAVSLGLLVLVAAHGHETLGAKRWLSIGPIHDFQPSELMKIALVLALARFYHGISAKSAKLSFWLLIPAMLIAAPAALVMKEPDLGTALLICATGVAIMILAGLDLRIVGLGAVLAGAVVPFLHLVLKPYQYTRLVSFMNPEAEKSGAGYHIVQSKIALGSGGLLGKGFGLGTQSQLNFLPEKQTDFMFASLAEEFGFVGCIAILALYAAVIFMSLRIASVAHSHFGRLGAAGVTATLTFCVLMNGAMVMGLAPVVGVPMPLLSWGGTVMMSMMLGFALIMAVRVQRYAEISSGKGSVL
ncbi:MAG TPA: rod shape-determining protein RodA [Caulobacteraceae bacterium]|nr:rod shape-determining protein RodA [Caulobacteraceae bacterium]